MTDPKPVTLDIHNSKIATPKKKEKPDGEGR